MKLSENKAELETKLRLIKTNRQMRKTDKSKRGKIPHDLPELFRFDGGLSVSDENEPCRPFLELFKRKSSFVVVGGVKRPETNMMMKITKPIKQIVNTAAPTTKPINIVKSIPGTAKHEKN